ncbi:hypothetical protein [Streptomyces sp. ST2-7A]|uniref:hypothetical protein n=1 Tax=Streptomyces sp. ST2-7A TaxID=2907214 RepID=UPI001F44C786|nr:hypothetical protein [Streptomyces sp. ST2-7A]MCE7081589.1 hypothetical protein [Streptomyces sp. ST2-7A]
MSTWPTGTVARYLTVGTATVDVTEVAAYPSVEGPTETVALCGGCGERHVRDWGFDFEARDRGEDQSERLDSGGAGATAGARRWAQSHAERCRALPKPEAGR